MASPRERLARERHALRLHSAWRPQPRARDSHGDKWALTPTLRPSEQQIGRLLIHLNLRSGGQRSLLLPAWLTPSAPSPLSVATALLVSEGDLNHSIFTLNQADFAVLSVNPGPRCVPIRPVLPGVCHLWIARPQVGRDSVQTTPIGPKYGLSYRAGGSSGPKARAGGRRARWRNYTSSP